jgi:ZIP family zinc transporter
MISTNILLGAVAAVSLFLGLPVARWRGASERWRGMLALVSAGVLLFLIIEVGYGAMRAVQVSARAGEIRDATQLALVFFIGFSTGLIGLSWLEEWRDKRRQSGTDPVEVATVIAIGLGLYNFAEGLALGHLFGGDVVRLGTLLAIGLVLHNATEGLSIAGPLVGMDVSWRNLLSLGLISGVPTALGAILGLWVSPLIELFFLSVATGSLIYVTRELFRIRFKTLGAIGAMTAVAAGFFIGFSTELVVQLGQSRAITHVTSP